MWCSIALFVAPTACIGAGIEVERDDVSIRTTRHASRIVEASSEAVRGLAAPIVTGSTESHEGRQAPCGCVSRSKCRSPLGPTRFKDQLIRRTSSRRLRDSRVRGVRVVWSARALTEGLCPPRNACRLASRALVSLPRAEITGSDRTTREDPGDECYAKKRRHTQNHDGLGPDYRGERLRRGLRLRPSDTGHFGLRISGCNSHPSFQQVSDGTRWPNDYYGGVHDSAFVLGKHLGHRKVIRHERRDLFESAMALGRQGNYAAPKQPNDNLRKQFPHVVIPPNQTTDLIARDETSWGCREHLAVSKGIHERARRVCIELHISIHIDARVRDSDSVACLYRRGLGRLRYLNNCYTVESSCDCRGLVIAPVTHHYDVKFIRSAISGQSFECSANCAALVVRRDNDRGRRGAGFVTEIGFHKVILS